MTPRTLENIAYLRQHLGALVEPRTVGAGHAATAVTVAAAEASESVSPVYATDSCRTFVHCVFRPWRTLNLLPGW
jgi:hypothetical protein